MTRAKDISKILTDADLSGTLDVTGTVTVGGNVGIGNSSPIRQLSLQNSSNAEISLVSGTSSNCSLLMGDGTSGTDFYRGYIQYQNSNDAMLFATSTGERMRIDSSGNVGIGESSPVAKTHIQGSGTSGQTTASLILENASSGTAGVDITGSAGSSRLRFLYGGGPSTGTNTLTEAMNIFLEGSNAGNVGIGTSSPNTKMTVSTGVNSSTRTFLVDNAHSGGSMYNAFGIYVGATDRLVTLSADYGDSIMAFKTNNTEAMRIDNSGNLLVGSTTTAPHTLSSGGAFTVRGSLNLLSIARADNEAMILNRTGSDGTILQFRKGGSEVGRIGSVFTSSQSRIFISNSNTGLHFNDGTEQIIPCVATGAKTDNSIDLGNASGRFDQIFSTNANLNTSDRNEKQDIEELSDAEQRVAVRCKSLVRKYRWIDAVSKKGDNARIHVGIIAQDLQDAFTAEGLDASRYSMFCSDTWWEKEITVDAVEADEENDIEAQDAYTYLDEKEEATEGYTERTRLGVRYTELLAFLISAI